ncbi:hypothetical protein LUZ61_010670 [Rhynchospora tenuis]|uniref:ELMO domain-containing protein n=1 Tax=Rhynchospora tenuis TaxID=198213 RepID=A0AAD5ZZN4_9POAL|nr:hypothetical protein LUZ61_010670 [Rhynchospora tenuis]
MEENGGSFVAVRRLSHGSERSTSCHSSPAEVVTGSTAWIGRGLSCVCAQRRESDARLSFDMTPSQEECLQRLQNRIDVSYDCTNKDHQDALKSLWYASFPGTELLGLISEQWKEMGWQGKDPSTDFRSLSLSLSHTHTHTHTHTHNTHALYCYFNPYKTLKFAFLLCWHCRGGGFISLENLLFFAKNFPRSFQELLKKQNGNRALWEYPFAVAGVNITFMLIQMLDLQAAKPRTLLGAIFLKLLSENERAFDILYCIAFKLMDQQWLSMHASYMDFNTVMKATRRQLEQELLMEDVQRIEDMPSYRLLSR